MKSFFKILFTVLITIFLLFGFAVPVNMVGNWYQQFMPSIGSRNITDVFFLDSLTGYAVTNATNQNPDTTFVLKTTNGGDNWIIQYRKIETGGGFPGYNRVYFLNPITGFVCGVKGLDKTTDGGASWGMISPNASYQDMAILDVNTIWLASSNPLTGGVFFTSNGGINWTPQFSGGNQNPNKIYMYNTLIGFMSNSSASPNIYKTTNGGGNWGIIVPGERFFDMAFVDSQTGWRTRGDTMKYTTNGGLNWSIQLMPYGGMIFSSNLLRFSVLNRDTIWGCGGYVLYPNNQVKSILYRTINGGNNWFFQIPDTSLMTFESFIIYTDRLHGWAYSINRTGIHTTTGGDPVWIAGVRQISNEIPKEYELYQNYPNPFNPITNIRYQITNRVKSEKSKVKIIIYDVIGKEIITLVNEEQQAGTYQVDFSGNNYSSGVYFYSLIVDNKVIDTKKMLLVK